MSPALKLTFCADAWLGGGGSGGRAETEAAERRRRRPRRCRRDDLHRRLRGGSESLSPARGDLRGARDAGSEEDAVDAGLGLDRERESGERIDRHGFDRATPIARRLPARRRSPKPEQGFTVSADRPGLRPLSEESPLSYPEIVGSCVCRLTDRNRCSGCRPARLHAYVVIDRRRVWARAHALPGWRWRCEPRLHRRLSLAEPDVEGGEGMANPRQRTMSWYTRPR